MKYAVYARKSSEDDDQQALSIPAQIVEIKELVKKYGYPVVNEKDIFFEEKSARKPGRRDEFNRLVDSINAGIYDMIFCWHINRLSRNPLEGGIIQQLIVEKKLRKIITPSDIVDSENCNEIIMSFLFGYSSQTSREISQNTKRGIREKIRRGEWPTYAPQFYENVGRKGKNYIIPHPEQSPFYEKWVDEIITNRLNQREARKLLIKWGVKTKKGKTFSISGIAKLLVNPIYCGILRYADYEDKDGSWEPLITKDKWYKLQEVIKEKSKPRLRKHRHQYNLLIKCNECGRSYTGYTTTKKSGLEFTYYVCSEKHGECKNLQISEKELEEQIAKYVGEVKLDEEKWAKLKALVLQKLEKEFNFESTVRKGVDIQIDQVNEKLDSLFDMKINKEIEIDDYQIKYKKIKDELNTLKSKRTDVEVTKDELKDEVDKFFDDIQTFKEVFLNGDYHEKRNLLFEITSHLGIENKKIDLNLKEPYKSVAFVKNSNDSNKWGSIVNLFRTRIIETELKPLVISIQLLFDQIGRNQYEIP